MGCLWWAILFLIPVFGAFGWATFQRGEWFGVAFNLVIIVVLMISLAMLEYEVDDERVG